MAKKISFVVRAASPIHVSSRKYLTFNETGDFIPATTLRGALANALYINSDNFNKLFVNVSRVRFENLYPLAKSYFADTVFVLPATAASCKRQPGFLSQFRYDVFKNEKKPYDKSPHGVFDLLISQLAYQIAASYDYEFKCVECSSKLEPFSHFYNIAPRDDSFLRSQKKYTKVLVQAEIPKRRLVRTAINRTKRTAEENLLFSLEVIEEGIPFFGTITVEDDTLASIVQMELKKLKTRRLGGIRSRGLGEVEVSTFKFLDFDSKLKNRILSFNHFLECHLQKLNQKKEGDYFTLDLQSDVILRNEKGESAALIDEQTLTTQLLAFDANLTLSGLRLVRWTTSQSYFSGYSDAWKLPKEIESTIKRGSIFVFKIDHLTDELVKALEQLQIWGIGERCEEGYGKVIICDAFHWGFQEKKQPYDENWRY